MSAGGGLSRALLVRFRESSEWDVEDIAKKFPMIAPSLRLTRMLHSERCALLSWTKAEAWGLAVVVDMPRVLALAGGVGASSISLTNS